MLSANLDRLDTVPYISPKMKELLEQIRELLETNPETGTIEVDGKNIFMLVVEATTQPKQDRRPEYHDTYLDIQILLRGSEILGYGHEPVNQITENLMAEKDVAFASEITAEKEILMAPRDFAVFFPGELHRPLVAPNGECGPVRKAILKIHRSVLEIA